ncbi:MAG: hypothetical protein ABI746_11735 [Dermatophilaceae bacterium]
MRKTLWALPLATALAMGIGGIPNASASSTTRSITVNNRYDSTGDSQVTNVAPIKAGDCTMYGILAVHRPNPSISRADVTFTSNTWTSHTTNYDQWHTSWNFHTFGGSAIAPLETIDGRRMKTNQTYFTTIEWTVPMTVSQWENISQVTWTGAC